AVAALLRFAPSRPTRTGLLLRSRLGGRSTFRRHRHVALVDPLLQQIDRHVLAGLETRAHPAGLAETIAGGLRPREHRDRRLTRLRKLAGQSVPVVGMPEEHEHLLRDLVDGLAPRIILPAVG